MPTKKYKAKIMKHRICSAARVIACASFIALAIIGVSSLVRAMTLQDLSNSNGVPSSWNILTNSTADTISVPVDYWDQHEDGCKDKNRQFEWVACGYYTNGALAGVVKDHLDVDGMPIPSFTNATDAWKANYDIFTVNVTGHEPVQKTDNFYRWFHEVPGLSKHYSGTLTFTRQASSGGSTVYAFERVEGTFPLDKRENVVSIGDTGDCDNGNPAISGNTQYCHNYHFTGHITIPIRVAADGSEAFKFFGDDDVWVFLNGKLVLDIGGLHQKLAGSFTIDDKGTVHTSVPYTNITSGRKDDSTLLNPVPEKEGNYVSTLNSYNNNHQHTATDSFDFGFKRGDIATLDVFYAERSTTESNVNITITNMDLLITGDSKTNAKFIPATEENPKNLIQFNTQFTNESGQPVDLERLAAFIRESADDGEAEYGYLPLDGTTLQYTTNPDDESSWKYIDISAPADSEEGFNLAEKIPLAANGEAGDTVYFRFFREAAGNSGNVTGTVSYYFTSNGASGISSSAGTTSYATAHKVRISYVYADDNSQASAPYEGSFKPGETFSIDSPIIDGYTPDIVKVSGTMGSEDLVYIVRYSRTPEEQPGPSNPDPDTRAVAIHYIYEDGSKAHDDWYRDDFYPGDDFSVKSPKIDGYTPDFEVVEGVVGNEDSEFFVRYKKIQDQTPSSPFPSAPVEPSQPGSDVVDDDLDYTPPLGEVAFVPNTGLVSDLIAPVFEQYFASVILSQGMVLSLLLIFAGSFATYFSLRRYLNFTMTPAAAVASRSSAKSARGTASAAKTAKKSALKTAKTMSKTSAKSARSAKTAKSSAKTTTRKSAKK